LASGVQNRFHRLIVEGHQVNSQLLAEAGSGRYRTIAR
jgi:hypothetical protein